MGTFFDANLPELLAAHGAMWASAASRAAPVLSEGEPAAHPLVAARAAQAAKSTRLEPGRYFPFIRIDVRHSFFNRTNGVCNELAVRPTPVTAGQLALFGLVARPRPDGLDILWASGLRDRAAAQLSPVMEHIAGLPRAERAQAAGALGQTLFGQALFFTVSLTNPLFANFTEMPNDFRIGDPPLLLSNRAPDARKGADRKADLIVDWKKRAGRGSQAVARPAMASWAMHAEARAKPTESGRPLVATGIASEIGGSRPIETRSRRFALLDLYLVREPGAAPVAGQWGGMPISLDPGGDERDPEGGGIFLPCTYTLRFQARQTRWRYIVAARSGELDSESLTVVRPDGADARFVPEKPRILPDGRPAACLASVDRLPILARPEPEHAFALLGTPTGARARPRMLIDRLPGPGIASISPEPSQVWSDIYVFV